MGARIWFGLVARPFFHFHFIDWLGWVCQFSCYLVSQIDFDLVDIWWGIFIISNFKLIFDDWKLTNIEALIMTYYFDNISLGRSRGILIAKRRVLTHLRISNRSQTLNMVYHLLFWDRLVQNLFVAHFGCNCCLYFLMMGNLLLRRAAWIRR